MTAIKLAESAATELDGQSYKTSNCHISIIGAGDTVIHDGKLMTVCKNNIKTNGFMGTTLFGDSYQSGNKSVVKVEFVQYNKELS